MRCHFVLIFLEGGRTEGPDSEEPVHLARLEPSRVSGSNYDRQTPKLDPSVTKV
jgi:hypothetical protein